MGNTPERRARAGDALRLRAEQVLQSGAGGAPQITSEQALELIHELHVHQVELELQNAELRRTQEALDLAHERYFELYDAAPVGYLTVSQDGRILELNRHAASLFGLSQTALGDVRLSRLVAPEDQDAYYLYHQQLVTIGAPGVCELRLQGAGGGRFWARLQAVAAPLGAEGEPVCRTALTDVSDRKRAEEGLREREAKFRSFFDRAPIGTTVTLPHGRLALVNQRFADMLGRTVEELGKLDVDAITHPDDVALQRECMRSALEGARDAFALEMRYLDRDGHAVLVSSNAALLRNADGDPLYFITTIEDIGARRKAELERHELQGRVATAERLASTGLLAASLAHEVNNPLAVVMGNLSLVLRDARLADSGALADLRSALVDAHEGADRVRLIVRDLGVFARGGGELLGPVDVRRVLESILRMAANELRHRARVVTAFAATPRVLASESRLGQVFLNLIANAAQAIPEGHVSTNEVRVETSVDDAGKVIVEVGDTGVGIAADDVARLFDPFFTTKSFGHGTGLGLSICHRLVTELGGTIAVQSTVGKGTVFRVVLPVAPPMDVDAARAAPRPAQPRRGRVLVIDDEVPVATLVRRVLRDRHDVVVAHSGREALGLFQAGQRFDVILCDLMMPEVTGMDVHAELARTLPDQAEAMIVVTGGAFTERGKAFLDSVTNPRIYKPFEPSALIDLIDRRLAERAVASAGEGPP